MKMNWEEVVIECLEQRLKEEEIRKAGLTAELQVQENLVNEIKAELKRGKEKENGRKRNK